MTALSQFFADSKLKLASLFVQEPVSVPVVVDTFWYVLKLDFFDFFVRTNFEVIEGLGASLPTFSLASQLRNIDTNHACCFNGREVLGLLLFGLGFPELLSKRPFLAKRDLLLVVEVLFNLVDLGGWFFDLSYSSRQVRTLKLNRVRLFLHVPARRYAWPIEGILASCNAAISDLQRWQEAQIALLSTCLIGSGRLRLGSRRLWLASELVCWRGCC